MDCFKFRLQDDLFLCIFQLIILWEYLKLLSLNLYIVIFIYILGMLFFLQLKDIHNI